MTNPHGCPLCPHTFEAETNLRVHLEVEHRKSELALLVVHHGESVDPSLDPEEGRERSVDRDATAPTA